MIASRVRGARMSLVQGAGHMGFMEAAGDYAAEIAGFAEQAFMTPRQARTAGDGADPAPRARPAGGEQPPTVH